MLAIRDGARWPAPSDASLTRVRRASDAPQTATLPPMGDEQRVSWINLSERDSFMGRMLAHFSLFVIPPPR